MYCSPERVGYTSHPSWDPYIPNASKMLLIYLRQIVLLPPPAKPSLTWVLLYQRHLGTMLGHKDYTATYFTSKVQAWCDEVKCLAEIIQTYFLTLPMQHLLMVCLVAGLTLCRLSPILKILCSPWRMSFINSLLQHCLAAPCIRLLRETCSYELLVHLGGLGLICYGFTHWVTWEGEKVTDLTWICGLTWPSFNIDLAMSHMTIGYCN